MPIIIICHISVYCLDPPVVQHATHNGAPEATSFPLETVLKYACYPGYVTVGFAHAKCFLYNDTAQWFGPDITCKGALKIQGPIPVQLLMQRNFDLVFFFRFYE